MQISQYAVDEQGMKWSEQKYRHLQNGWETTDIVIVRDTSRSQRTHKEAVRLAWVIGMLRDPHVKSIGVYALNKRDSMVQMGSYCADVKMLGMEIIQKNYERVEASNGKIIQMIIGWRQFRGFDADRLIFMVDPQEMRSREFKETFFGIVTPLLEMRKTRCVIYIDDDPTRAHQKIMKFLEKFDSEDDDSNLTANDSSRE